MTTTKQSWLKQSLAVLLAVMMVMSMGVANVFAAGTESSEKSVKEQLQELVDYADTLDPADYTPESWSPVNILLTGIKANINNEEMLSQYGEQWLSTLKQKLDDLVLVEKSVKEQLQELLDYADTLDPTDYTPESWSPVNILLTGIKANINNEEMLSQYGEQWLSTLKQKIDELVPTAGQKPDEDVTNLENGIYRIPVKGYLNLTNYEGQTDSALYPYGLLEITDEEKQITIRLNGYSAFDNFFVLHQEYMDEYRKSGKWTTFSPNASDIKDDNQSKEDWLNDGWLSQTDNEYYMDSSEFTIVVNEEMDYADITIPLENINDDMVYQGYPKYVSNDSMSKNGRRFVLKMEPTNAEKIHIPENGEYSWSVVVDDGSQGSNLSNNEMTDQIQSMLSKDGIATAMVDGEKATIEVELSNKDIVDVKTMTKRTLSGASSTLISRFKMKSTNASDYESVLKDGNKAVFTVDISSYKDLVFGKRILITLKTEQTPFYGLVSFLTSEVEDLNLTDATTGLSYKTQSSNVSKGTTFTAMPLTKEDDSYSTYESFFGTSYANWSAWEIKLERNGIEVIPTRNGTLSIPIPDGWDSDLIHLFRVNMYGNYEEQDISIDGGNIVTQTSEMGTYILCVERNYATDGSNLEEGTYSVDVAVWNMIQNQPSMADQGVKSPAKLVVENDKKILYLEFEAVSNLDLSSYMTHMWIYNDDVVYSDAGYPQGDTYEATVYEYYRTNEGEFLTDVFNEGSLNYYPKQIYFVLPNDKAEFPVRFRVPVMDQIGGGDFAQDARFRIDYSTAEKISAETPDVPIKNALIEEIAVADTLNQDEWTYSSWSALNAAYNAAKKLNNDSSATVEELMDAHADLKNAMDNLVSSTVDTSKLEELIAEAEKYKSEDYTAETYDALVAAIKNAKAVLNSDMATQVEIDAEETSLQNAIDALKTKDSEELDINNLPDGKYTLYAQMIKTDRENFSMSNNAINHNVWLEVIDGEYYLTMQFKGLTIENKFGYLMNLSYYDAGYTYNDFGIPQGTLIPAEVLSTQKNADGTDVIDIYNDADHLYPEMIRLKLVDKAAGEYVPLHVFVPIMEAISEGTGSQDVLMKLDWSLLKLDDGEIKPEEPVEQSPAVDYTDAATGVKVNADKGVFDEGVQIVVSEITKGADYDNAVSSLSDVGKKFKLYDIKFLDADGNEVAPNGTVSISFPIVAGYDSANLAVYRLDDGGKVLVRGTVENGYYTVITKTAGAYTLVEKGSTITDAENTENAGNQNQGNTNIPQTGDTSNIAVYVLLALAAAGMMGVTMVTRKRKAEEK